MLAKDFADSHPVITALLIVVALALVAVAVLFQQPIERLLDRLLRAPCEDGPPSSGALWVDDRPDHNARLLNSLRGQGVRLDVACSTAEAVDRLREHTYAIIVSDMSRIEDGDTVLRELERASRQAPVVIFSPFTETSELYSDRAVVSSEAEIKEWLRAVHLLP
ncbi:response regulator [Actinophytocola oryzae]|uniref:Response regulator receiver domain-containing protein n=1 Tax=Actinophytocola oryzae TaxID=502181 RepID=A0A4R7VCL6_9PSEU|nr:response regulator [Actinophytocola oryzae]TDV46842.1 response regulator receiver domain-containing protein [Actinophytocola oryzae]